MSQPAMIRRFNYCVNSGRLDLVGRTEIKCAGTQVLAYAGVLVVMDATLAQIFFKPEKNLEFFRLKICARDVYPGKLE